MSFAPLAPSSPSYAQNVAQMGFLGKLSESTIGQFKGPKDTLELMAKHALGPRGEQSMLVRQFTEWCLRDVWPKDYLGEIIAIRNIFVQPSPTRRGVPLFKYANDPRHVEMVKDPQRMVEEIMQHGSCVCDCDDFACMAATMALQMGREVDLVAMGFKPKSLSHVGCRVKEPKSNRWIWIDGVAGPKEKDAARRAKTIMIHSLD